MLSYGDLENFFTSPKIYAQMGYSAFVLNRIPDPEKQAMKANKGMVCVAH